MTGTQLSLQALKFCEENDNMICLPSHTTHRLQPLDRSFFKPLKNYYNNECNTFIRNTQGDRKINKLSFGRIFRAAWLKAVTRRVESDQLEYIHSTQMFSLNMIFYLGSEQQRIILKTLLYPTNLLSHQYPNLAQIIIQNPCLLHPQCLSMICFHPRRNKWIRNHLEGNNKQYF